MTREELEARLASMEARLDALDGGKVDQGPKRAPASPQTFVKRDENQFPKWVFMVQNGELKQALIQTADEMPKGAAESPEQAWDNAKGAPSAQPASKTSGGVVIPDNWRAEHHFKRIALAKALPGGEGVVSADDADAIIELELERRGNG